MTGPVTVRPLRPDDREQWEPLWRGYHTFYRSEDADALAEVTFSRLCEGEPMLGLLAVLEDETAVGLAHLVFHPSTWSAQPSCYLEDLFVDRGTRGSGIAKQLIEHVYGLAKDRGAGHVYWMTQEFNGRARSLYDTVADLRSFVIYEHEL